jgi:Protein of unknown function (DUF1579)
VSTPSIVIFKRALGGALALVALAASCVEARDAVKEASAAPGIAQLAYFEGTWRCTGKIRFCPSTPECATTGNTRIEKAIGGTWLHVTGDETIAEAVPETIHFALYFGYDSGRKSYVALGVGGPGIYGTQYSKGWRGDKFVLSPDKYLARDTFEKKSADEFAHTADTQGKDGKWTNIQEETCRRVR